MTKLRYQMAKAIEQELEAMTAEEREQPALVARVALDAILSTLTLDQPS